MLNNGSAVGASNLIAPLHLADRVRDKIRATVTWTVSEPLAVQLMVDEGHDDYDPRTALDLGVRKGRMQLYSVDPSYRFSDRWQANAWYTNQDLRQEQATQFPGTPITNWGANIANDSDTVGLGMLGKPTSNLSVGADLMYTTLKDKFGIFTASLVITGSADRRRR